MANSRYTMLSGSEETLHSEQKMDLLEPEPSYLAKTCGVLKRHKLLCLQLLNFQFFFLLLYLFDARSKPVRTPYEELNVYSSKRTFEHVGFAAGSASAFDKPPGHGIVAVPDAWAEDNGLPPSMASPFQSDHRIYQISVFHQLHCIDMIWKQLSQANTTSAHHHTAEHSFSNTRHEDHVLHCVDWLRQALMCNADVTLDATDDLIAFGDKSTHQCKDFSAISRWAEEHRFKEVGRYLKESRPEFLVPEGP